MAGQRILVVEDEAIILMVLSEVLNDHGFDVISARTGEDASSLLQAETFDLLMTDIRLPGAIGGVELARLARERSPSIPIIVASGFAEPAKLQLEALSPPVVVLHKPYNLDSVARLMASLTGAKKNSL